MTSQQLSYRLVMPVALVVLALGAVRPAAAQTTLPEGPGKETTVKICGTCHPAERGVAVRLTREGWQELISRMVSLGAKGTDAELQATLEYLATHFEGDALKPLNLNKANSVELESIVGLLRKESAAWIAYRAKHGPCTALEDLKKVPGLDFAKIEKRRDRIVCFVLAPAPAQ